MMIRSVIVTYNDCGGYPRGNRGKVIEWFYLCFFGTDVSFVRLEKASIENAAILRNSGNIAIILRIICGARVVSSMSPVPENRRKSRARYI